MRNSKWGSRALMAAVMSGLLGFAAQAQEAKPSKEQMKQEKTVGEAAAKRQRYLGKLQVFNAKQIALAQLAQEQASDQRVKDFAKQLEQDHVNSRQELKDFAESRKIEVSSVDLSAQGEGMGGSGHMEEGYQKGMENVGEKLGKGIDEARKDINDLKGKQGKEFDKAFLSRIASDQKYGRDVLKDGRKEFKSDASFLTLLSKTETVVDNNESTVKKLEKEIK